MRAVLYQVPKCRLFRRHRGLRALLDGESQGSGRLSSYGSSGSDPIDSNALFSTAWELSLLRLHYHPHAAQSAAAVSQIPPDGGPGNLNGIVNTASEPSQLAAAYACHATGLFKPPPQKASPGKGRHAKTVRPGAVMLQSELASVVGAYAACKPWCAWPCAPMGDQCGCKLTSLSDHESVDEAAVLAEFQQRFR
jgi:hypothetical protein